MWLSAARVRWEEVIVRRRVKDVMTADVAYVRERTPYKELVRLLAERRVSALPVVDVNRNVIGIVSEADLLLKQQHPADSFQRFQLERKRRRVERAKARGGTAAELMSRPAITIGPDATVAEAARLLRMHLIKQLPVADPLGRLVGIVSRCDLLSVFLRPDDEIRREILQEVIFSELGMGPDRFDVRVREGVVKLQGSCERRSLIPALVRAVAAVEGVVRVENHLGYDLDDTALPQLLVVTKR
jgi:CBS-domain-containing membrane protein